MSNKSLYVLWGGLFILCAGLGFIPEPEGGLQAGLTAVSLLFFLPPFLLLYRGKRRQDAHTLQLIRNLAAVSLGLTLALLIANFLTALAPEFLGTVLYYLLVIVSAPMVSSGYWVLSLFLWACLLMASRKGAK